MGSPGAIWMGSRRQFGVEAIVPSRAISRAGDHAFALVWNFQAPASDAVELRLKSGDIRRIGTDDPLALAEALKPAARGG